MLLPLGCDEASDAFDWYPLGSYGPAAGTFANGAVCRVVASPVAVDVVLSAETVPAAAGWVDTTFNGGTSLIVGVSVVG